MSKRTVRPRLSSGGVTALLLSCSLASACTLTLRRDERQCDIAADCRALGDGLVCASDGVCVSLTYEQTAPILPLDGACVAHADCAQTSGPALCVDGSCLPLSSADAGCVSLAWGTPAPPDAAPVLLVGMLVPAAELELVARRQLTGAVALAIAEFNRARLQAGVAALPALVGVACDEARVEAIEYLVGSLGARVVVGPTSSRYVPRALAVTAERAVLLAPFADGPELESEPQPAGSWLATCKPNRVNVQPYFLRAIDAARAKVMNAAPELAPLVTALAVSGDESTQRFAAGFNDEQLAAASIAPVRYTSEPGGVGLVRALAPLDVLPSFVVAASAEDDWAANMQAYDSARYAAAGDYPYYLLADERSALKVEVVANEMTAPGFPERRQRLLGLDYHRDEPTELAHADFRTAFSVELEDSPDAGLEYAYDCAYAGVLAALAARLYLGTSLEETTASAIASGLTALTGGGPALPVRASSIPEMLEALAVGAGTAGSVDLIGISGPLDFTGAGAAPDPYGEARHYGVGAPDGELYCIDDDSTEFCGLGIVFPANGGPATEEPSACSCLATSASGSVKGSAQQDP
jgi:hypothetical protein